jgi:O-antigen/teichoic acid export membrane protein
VSRLSRNILYNGAGTGLTLLLSFVVVKFVYSRLGSDALGLIYLNTTLTLLVLAGLELGISVTTVREISVHHRSDPSYVTTLIRSASAIYWSLTALAGAILFFSAPWLVQHWLNLRELDPPKATVALQILAVAAVLTLPKVLYTSLFRGRQLMGINNGIDVGMSTVQQIGTVAIIAAHGDLVQVAIWIAACAVVGQLVYIGFALYLFGARALMPWLSIAVLRRNASFAIHMMSTSILSIVHTQTDKVTIAKLLPLSQFGYYGVASSVLARALLLTSAVAQASLPVLTDLHNTGDQSGMVRQYRKLQDLVCFATVPLFTALVFASRPLFSFLLDRAAAAQLIVPAVLLAVGFYMNGTMTIPFMVSIATGRPGIASRTNLWALLLSVPTTILLILIFGLVGAAASWIFYHGFLYIYMAPRVSRECLHLPASDWFAQLARPVLLTVTVYGSAWALASILGLGLLSLILAWTLGTMVFTLLGYLLIGSDLRGTLRGFGLRLSV